MTRHRLLRVFILTLFSFSTFFALFACGRKKEAQENKVSGNSENPGPKLLYYQCPMHHQIRRDEPGNCPICGMTLVPIHEESHSHGGEGSDFTISSERQQMIGIKTSVVTREKAFHEIRTSGRVAFDPELAVAQSEYLEIVKNVPDLKFSARQRLGLLGMSDEEIRDLEKSGRSSKNLYLPGGKDEIWVYATLFTDEADLVTVGDTAILKRPDEAASITGIVKGLTPIVDPTTRSIKARIETRAPWRLNTAVDVTIKIDLGEKLLIPQSAVIDTGTRKIVFVVDAENRFSQREIETGAQAGTRIVVEKGLNEGEKIVSEGTFIVDAESELRK